MRGEKYTNSDLVITGVTDCGLIIDDILTGKKTVPLQEPASTFMSMDPVARRGHSESILEMKFTEMYVSSRRS